MTNAQIRGDLMGHSKMQGYFISPFRMQNLSTSFGIYNLTFLYTHLTNRLEIGYAGTAVNFQEFQSEKYLVKILLQGKFMF